MTSTPYQSSSRDRPEFPEIEAEIGEDPARFLFVGEVTEHGDALAVDELGDSPPLALAITRIRGIRDLDVIQAWISVEAELGPRQQVMKELNQQKARLQDQSAATSDAEVAADV